jgi:hypothetical protein
LASINYLDVQIPKAAKEKKIEWVIVDFIDNKSRSDLGVCQRRPRATTLWLRLPHFFFFHSVFEHISRQTTPRTFTPRHSRQCNTVAKDGVEASRLHQGTTEMMVRTDIIAMFTKNNALAHIISMPWRAKMVHRLPLSLPLPQSSDLETETVSPRGVEI